MGAINYSRGGWVMQHSRQKCWDEGPCGLRGGVGGLRGGVGGLCGGPGEAGRGARRHRGRFSREARAHSPPSRPPLRWGIPGARGAGCLFPGRPERLAGHSWRARSGHCPRRGFSCHIPVGEDKEAASAPPPLLVGREGLLDDVAHGVGGGAKEHSPPRLRLAASWSSLTGIWQANPRLGQCPRLARGVRVRPGAPGRRGADVLPVNDPSRTRP